MKRSVATAAALLLAACGDDGSNAPVQKIRVTSPQLEQLKAAPAQTRNFGLWRAIRDSGMRCQKVERSGFQQDYENLSMWTASCPDGRRWAIFIAGNGDVQVRNCAELRTLGLPECRTPGGAARQTTT